MGVPVDISVIKEMATGQIKSLAAELLPNGVREGHEWCIGSIYGERGRSMRVNIEGPKAGIWQDFASPEHTGDVIDLVCQVRCGGNMANAVKWLRGWLAIEDLDRTQFEQRRKQAKKATEQRAKQEETERKERAGKALGLWLYAEKEVLGTPVDDYLFNRGIDLRRLGRQPGALRFHPNLWCGEANNRLPAMVWAVAHPILKHCSTHRTWLQCIEGDWVKAKVPNAKKSYGSFAGGSIPVWRGASGKSLSAAPEGEAVVITEGVEDALSIALACPERRILCAVSLGNMRNVLLPDQIGTVILAADNDSDPQAQAAFRKAELAHIEAGRDVRIARSPSGKDFNDLLQEAPG